jgi:hypothetical protein
MKIASAMQGAKLVDISRNNRKVYLNDKSNEIESNSENKNTETCIGA